MGPSLTTSPVLRASPDASKLRQGRSQIRCPMNHVICQNQEPSGNYEYICRSANSIVLKPASLQSTFRAVRKTANSATR
eukprot:7126172-Alexandrium_andersonii.AAC.1